MSLQTLAWQLGLRLSDCLPFPTSTAGLAEHKLPYPLTPLIHTPYLPPPRSSFLCAMVEAAAPKRSRLVGQPLLYAISIFASLGVFLVSKIKPVMFVGW
jgi:hypothetical protein